MRSVNVIPPRSLLLLLAAIGTGLSPAVSRAASPLESLLNNSPFGTAPRAGQSVDAANQPMELRSVMGEKGQESFSIRDTATNRSLWIDANVMAGDIVIKGYNDETHTVSLERNGQPLSLTLKSGPRIAQNIQTPPPPMQPGNAGLPGQQVMANNMGKGPEAQRMQQIAEEIRRRRALRQQAPNMPMPTPGAPSSGGPMPLPGMSSGSGPMPLPGMSGSSGPMPVATPGTSTGPMPTPASGTSTGPAITPTRQ